MPYFSSVVFRWFIGFNFLVWLSSGGGLFFLGGGVGLVGWFVSGIVHTLILLPTHPPYTISSLLTTAADNRYNQLSCTVMKTQ